MAKSPENTTNHEKLTVDDNARKFVVAPIDEDFLRDNGIISYLLVTNWLETNPDTEKKVVRKEYPDGTVELLLISKVTKNGLRTAKKNRISEEEYTNFVKDSVVSDTKTRSEFPLSQDGKVYSLKYDSYGDIRSPMLEVDAETEQDRNAFNPQSFPYHLTEVTGNTQHYGYHIAEVAL